MMGLVDLLQSFLQHVRVNLGGGDIRVPQHHLYRTQVRASFQKVSRKAMAQLVRRQLSANPGTPPVLAQDSPYGDAADSASETVQEQARLRLRIPTPLA